ncbi:MAG: hypothetical protein SGJ09_13855 [Phycisphaerae bacterium]|nr:hypothetical protein [Phycisphaerae bacterium]
MAFIPSDLAGIDRLLSGSHLDVGGLPDGLVHRIFVASCGSLPAPQVLATISPSAALVGRGASAVRVLVLGQVPARVWGARFALAAAVALAVGTGMFLAINAPATPSGRELAQTNRSTVGSGRGVTTTPAAAPESTLVALMDDRTSDQWVDEESFGRSPFSQDVAPVLRVRNAGLDDFAHELKSIFGSG